MRGRTAGASAAGGPAATPTAAARANGAISFRVGGGDGPSWIDAVEPDGSGRRTVFGDDARIAQIAWSPDGTRIAYQDPITSERGIFVANADGTDPVRLTRGANDAWPSWSPDGTTIVFASSRADPSVGPCEPAGADLLCPTDIYAIGVDGSDLRRLTTDPAPEYQPAWSPDGSAIAFVRASAPAAGTEGRIAAAISAMDPDGTDVRQVSGAAGAVVAPSWSPDGERLVFAASQDGRFEVRMVGADGSDEHPVLGDGWFAYEAEWSPDGELIAFVGDPSAGDHSPQDALYVMRPDGSGIRMLADAPRYGVAGDIAWRPSPVGSSPAWEFGGDGLAVAGGSVWTLGAVRAGTGGCCHGLVTRIDPATNAVVDELVVPGITDGDLWVAGDAVDVLGFEAIQGRSSAFDPRTRTIWVQHDRGSVVRVRLVTSEA